MSFASYSESANDASQQKASHILVKERIKADDGVAKNLQIPEGTDLIRLYRLMLENGKPYMIDTAYFMVDRFPGIFDLLVEDVSTFGIMRTRYGVEFTKAVKAVGVIRAGVEESRLLKCVPGDPLFSISKVIYDRSDVPIHYSHYLVLGDRCVYTLTVTSEMEDMQVHYRDIESSLE
jgi:GntR family frlABCD operon transcriptional regulator